MVPERMSRFSLGLVGGRLCGPHRVTLGAVQALSVPSAVDGSLPFCPPASSFDTCADVQQGLQPERPPGGPRELGQEGGGRHRRVPEDGAQGSPQGRRLTSAFLPAQLPGDDLLRQ